MEINPLHILIKNFLCPNHYLSLLRQQLLIFTLFWPPEAGIDLYDGFENNPRVLKKRLIDEGSNETVTKCNGSKMMKSGKDVLLE